MDTNKFTGLLLFTVAVIMLAPQAFAFGKSEEIGCNGKDFLCFNESSFYVCVDTGGTDTVAEGELQHCLWGLVCRNSSIYECEEPHYVVTTTFKPENNTTEEDNFTVEASTSTQTETNDSNIKTTTNVATTKDGYSTTENKIGTSDLNLGTNTQHTDTETYKTDRITKDEYDSTTESAKVTITSCMDDSPGGTGTVNHSCRGTPDTSLSTTQINNETTTVSANSQTNSSDNTTIPDKLITTETSLMENTTINEDLLTTNEEDHMGTSGNTETSVISNSTLETYSKTTPIVETKPTNVVTSTQKNASRETTNVAFESTTQKFTSTTQDNGNTHDSITETEFVSNSNNDETTESFENTTQFDQEEVTTKNQGSTKANNSETTSEFPNDSSTSSENISTNKNDNSNASSSEDTMKPSENTTPFEESSTPNETSDRSDSTSPIDQYTTSNISTEPTNQTNPTRDHENTESNTFSGPTTIFGSNINGTSTTVKEETETIGSHQLSTRENERTEVTTFSPDANNNSKTIEYTSIAHESMASNPGNNTEQVSNPSGITQSTIEYDTTIHSTKPDIENHLSTYGNDGSTKQANATLAQESSTTTVSHIDNETASTSVPSDTAAPITNENRTTEREDVTASVSLTETHESSPLHESTTTSTNPNRQSTTTVHTDAVSNSTDSIRDTTSKINPTSAHEETKSTEIIQTSTVTSSITTADTNGNEKTSKTSTAESTTAEDGIETTNNDQLSTGKNDGTEVPDIIETSTILDYTTDLVHNSIPHGSTTQNQVDNATESSIGYSITTTDDENRFSTYYNETTGPPEIINTNTVSGSNHDSTTLTPNKVTTNNYDSDTASTTNNNSSSTTSQTKLTTIGITTESITNSVPEDNNDITSNSSVKGETSTTETETTNDNKLSTRGNDETEVTTSEYEASSGTEDNSIPYGSTTQNQVGNATESTIGYGTITTGLPEQTDHESQLSTHSNETTELPEIMNSTTVSGSNHDTTTSTTANNDSGTASSTHNNNFGSTTYESKLTTIGITTESITNSVPEDNNDITSNSSIKEETSTTETETTNDKKDSTHGNDKTEVTAMHESTTLEYKASSVTEDNSILYDSTTQNQVGNVTESTVGYGTITTGLPEQTDYESQLSTHSNETTELPEIMNSTTVSGSNHDSTTSTTANYDSGTASSTHDNNFSSTTSESKLTTIGITTESITNSVPENSNDITSNSSIKGETSTTETETTNDNKLSTRGKDKTEVTAMHESTTPYYKTTSGTEDNSIPYESTSQNQVGNVTESTIGYGTITTGLPEQTDYESQLSTHSNETTELPEIMNSTTVSGSNHDSTTSTTANYDSGTASSTHNNKYSSTTSQSESTMIGITTESITNSVPEDNSDITSNSSIKGETSTTETETTNDKTEVTAMHESTTLEYKASSGTEDNSIPYESTTQNQVGNATESTIGYGTITTGLPEQTDNESQLSTHSNETTELPEIMNSTTVSGSNHDSTTSTTANYDSGTTSSTHNNNFSSTTSQSESTMIGITTNFPVHGETSTTEIETTNNNEISTREDNKTEVSGINNSTTSYYEASSGTEESSTPHERTIMNQEDDTESTIGLPKQTDYENQLSTQYNEPTEITNTNRVSGSNPDSTTSTQNIVTNNNIDSDATSTTNNSHSSSTTSQNESTINRITTESVKNSVPEDNNDITSNFSVDEETSTTRTVTTNNNKFSTSENDKTEATAMPDYKTSSGTEDNSIPHDSTTLNPVANATEFSIGYDSITTGLPEQNDHENQPSTNGSTKPPEILDTNASTQDYNPNPTSTTHNKQNSTTTQSETTMIEITTENITNFVTEDNNNISSNSSVDEGTSTTKTETTNDNKLSTSENDRTKLTAMHESTTLDYKANSGTEDNSIPYESTTQNPVGNTTESTIGHDSITTGQPEQTDYENQFSTRYNGSTGPPEILNTNTPTRDIVTTNNYDPNPASTTHNKQSATTSQSGTTMIGITTENITNSVPEGNNSSANGEISTTEPLTTNNNKLSTRENDKTEVMDKSTTPDYIASSGTEDNSISYDSTTQNQVGNNTESIIEYGTATAGFSTHYKGTTHYDETTEPSDIMKTSTSIYSSNPDLSTMQAISTSTSSITFESTTIGITEGGITNSLPENDNIFVTTNTALPYVNDSASTESIQFTTLRENITNTVKVTTKNTNIENHKTESPTQVTTTMKQETISSPTVSDGEEPSTNRITEGPYTTEQIPTKVITEKYNTQTTKKYQQTDHSTSTVATTDSKLDSKTSIVTDDRHLITITDESSEEISEEYTEETDFSNDYSDESSDADELTTVPIEEAKTTLSSTQRPQTTFPSIDSEFECSKAGKFADKYNYHIFYLCIRMKNGYRKLPYPCPSGTTFDPKRKYCSLRNKKCDPVFTCESSGFFPDPEHESKFYICFYNSLSHEFLVKHITCPGRAIFDADKQICVYAKLDVSSEEDDSEEFVCGDVGKFPVQDNCQYYYLCIFKRHEFKMSMKKCPKNKLFDRHSQICRYKNFVKCDDYNK